MKKHILIVAGDPSADRHAAELVRALKEREPDLRISALGGDHLRAVVDAFLYPLVGIGGFGFWEPLLKLPQLWKARQCVRRCIASQKPDLVIPMDYYGFNIHTARIAHAAAVPVVYYISPQVWASRPGRIQDLKSVLQKILVILPFEVPLYEKSNVPVSFVGHPLVETMPRPEEPSEMTTIGLLPGSRRGVVQRHLPILVETMLHMKKEFPLAKWILFRPSEIEASFYKESLSFAPEIRLVCDDAHQERRRLTLAISVSGTAALENMLLGIPMIIMYRLSALTYFIAKRLIHIPFVGMPNILAGRVVVPEHLQSNATPELLAEAAGKLLKDPVLRNDMRQTLLGLRATLEGGGSSRAAEEILKALPKSDTVSTPQKVAR